jgi:hypothetical protein
MDLPPSDDGQAPTADVAVATPPVSEPGRDIGSAPGATEPQANMVAHISMRGDVVGRAGEWLGEPGSRLALEAILLAPAPAGPLHLAPSVECQLIYPKGLTTPWTIAGRPCGSAGFGLACLGIRFRLSAETAPFFVCQYDITFIDGTRQDDVPGRDFALSPSGAAVEAIRLHVAPREPVSLIVLNDLEAEPAPGELETAGEDPAVRLRLLSPAFATRMPEIRNAASIPPGPWRSMAVSFNRRVFGGRNVTFRLIDDAIVVGEGIVFDRDLTLIPGTTRLMGDEMVAQYRQLAMESRGPDIRRIAGMSVLCKTRNPGNYGHFLMEMYPKAWLTARLLSSRHVNYIIHQTGINPFAISVTDERPVQCESLIVIDGLTSHGVFQSPICAQALTDLGERIPATPYPKIFVSRHSRDRMLHNQEAVEGVLRDRGFAIVSPELMTLAEQISLFKGASTVVGPLGAALTNTVFCPRGATIVALTPQSFPDTFFWFLSQHRGHYYHEVRGPDVSGTPDAPQSWNAGFTISDEDLAFLATL